MEDDFFDRFFDIDLTISKKFVAKHLFGVSKEWCLIFDEVVFFMLTGKVKFFNETKGFGFITCDNDGKEIFFHISAVKDARVAKEGDRAEFEITLDPRSHKERAEGVVIL